MNPQIEILQIIQAKKPFLGGQANSSYSQTTQV